MKIAIVGNGPKVQKKIWNLAQKPTKIYNWVVVYDFFHNAKKALIGLRYKTTFKGNGNSRNRIYVLWLGCIIYGTAYLFYIYLISLDFNFLMINIYINHIYIYIKKKEKLNPYAK